MSFLDGDFDDELNKELENVNYTSTPVVAATETAQKTKTKVSKKRKKPEESVLKKLTNRKKHLTRDAAVIDEIRRMQAEHDTVDQSKPVDGFGMTEEIHEANAKATRMLEELDALLNIGNAAVQATNKYSILIGQLERHRTESNVLDRTCAVFTKLLQAVASARDSCSRLPTEFAQMLVRHEAYMRASSSALVPSGISIIGAPSGDSASNNDRQLTVVTASTQPMALVRFGGPQSKSTFKLVADDRSAGQVSEMQNSYLSTSMMHHNYNPLQTVTATNAARRDSQRRAAQLQAGSEFMPELFGTKQQMAVEAAAAAVLTGETPRAIAAAAPPPRLAIQHASHREAAEAAAATMDSAREL